MTAVLLGSITLAARDPGSTRLVYGIVIGLVVLGCALVALTWWLVRTTRPDPEFLAPLEAIQTRRWRRLDPADRRRLLDDLRPDGAQPAVTTPRRPAVDDAFDREPVHRDVRDLADPERSLRRRLADARAARDAEADSSSDAAERRGGGVVGEVGLGDSDVEEDDLWADDDRVASRSEQ